MDDTAAPWKAPYFAFSTFWNFMADLAQKPLPPKIDRSLLKSKSGTDQANLFGALRAFDLIDENGVVNASALAPIAQGDDKMRSKHLEALVRHYYTDALRLSDQSGTEGQLHELFKTNFGIASADTRRKAVTFFLHAARQAGIELSQHFPTTRSGSGGPGAARSTRPKTKRASSSEHRPTHAQTVASNAVGETKTVDFGDAGSVVVTVNVKWLDLPDSTFTKLRQLIKDLEALEAADDSSATQEEVSRHEEGD